MSEQRNGDRTPASGGAGSGSVAAGVALIVVGLVFLLSNVTGWRFNNWWALFILIPALFLLGNAVRQYRADGRFSGRVTQAATGAIFMLLVALVFLFNLDWGTVWPAFLIIGGIAAISSGSRSG